MPVANGDLLMQLREQRHLTQEALAEAVGIDRRNLRNWEQGRGQIRLKTFYPLAVYFGYGGSRFAELLIYPEPQAQA